ncbi:rhodanese-related sulfurtransferase [Methylobacterium brachiatum]|uniref:Rhodanese-related sulfurtransferase n=1 Tax=Methylobacterium brachiatum TaxID=269660 RepID=A0AAJ1U1B5_9HYPH|nr:MULTISPECIES: sulfurtransferase/chromate resistance protein [Methylobacterium]MCB4806455.1 sulfurtransferase/chromate resistance protein [Methylobacterium brachiatum]MDQ0547478.1 rhodanese-related sulfurtransferase [Methylobacterium brachiatum]WKV18915.1 chromate resistance protein [Methylobacterium radiotolerans JCM 2831]
MPVPNTISVDKLARLIGTPACPVLVDVRTTRDFAEDPRLIPGSRPRQWDAVAEWAPSLGSRPAVVICQRGHKLSHGVAAWLRTTGIAAEALDGGTAEWARAGLPMVPADKLQNCDGQGRTVWVTRARPKVDRIACPWLIRRFIDREAVFLFVPPSEVEEVARRFNGEAFDIDAPEVFWNHRGELCTFDVMVQELGLATPPLLHLATLVRGADTARPDLAPEAAGLLAASLGLSRIYANDLAQLDAGMLLYDAFYRWCRDATDEDHNRPTNKPRSGV